MTDHKTTSKQITDIKGKGLFRAFDRVQTREESDYLNQRYGAALLTLEGGEIHESATEVGLVYIITKLRVTRVDDTTRHPQDTYEKQRPFQEGELLTIYSSLVSKYNRHVKEVKKCLGAAFGGSPDDIDGETMEACYYQCGKLLKGKQVYCRMEPRVADNGRVFYNPRWSRASADDASTEAADVAFGS